MCDHRCEQLFRQEDGELIVQMPEGGVDPSWLARPPARLGLPPAGAVSALRVESAPDWRWDTADAAFITLLVQQLDGADRRLDLRGLTAQLVRQSFVTGLLNVDLDIRPNVEPVRLGEATGAIEVPTVPGDLERITRRLEGG